MTHSYVAIVSKRAVTPAVSHDVNLFNTSYFIIVYIGPLFT